jgi:hypothetical protein
MNNLFDMAEEWPAWKIEADRLGIVTKHNEDAGMWSAEIDMFNAIEHESAETEKLAVEALIFRLKLK